MKGPLTLWLLLLLSAELFDLEPALAAAYGTLFISSLSPPLLFISASVMPAALIDWIDNVDLFIMLINCRGTPV